MRYAAVFAIILACAAFLFVGCIQQPQLPSTQASGLSDHSWYSGPLNATGTYGNISLAAAYSRHVFSIWTTFGAQQVNSTTYSALVNTRTCSNTTLNASIDGCANTTAVGTGNFSTYKAATTYSMTVITTADTFNNTTGTFDMSIYGTNLNQANSSDTAYVYLYKPTQAVWYNTGYSLQANTSNWTNITGLTKAEYISSTGAVQVKFEAATSGANASKAGITIDYLAFNGTNTYNITGVGNSTVVFQTSLDNVNWFTDQTVTNISSTAARYQTNNTALYSRFTVSGITATNPLDAVYIQYVAVSN